jgi:AraC family transcriptional regulator
MGTEHDCLPHSRHVLAQCLGQNVTVTDFRCHACRHPMSSEECNIDPAIVFVRRGIFVRTQESETVVADANHVLFFNPQQPYRISHPIDGGDACTVLTISQAFALEIVARHAPRAAERSPRAPFLTGHGRATRNAWRMHYELLANLAVHGDLAFEERVLGIVDWVVGVSHGSGSNQRGISWHARHRTTRRHRELAHAAVVAINRDLASPPSLTQLAAALSCSSYHLSRVFREVLGSSLRCYLSEARARAAADAIARGARNLTELALRLGYVDHSHFTNAFNKEWNMSPSAFRSTLNGRV